jgi:predicted DNA-binding ribbon-helix-helix protein
MPSRFKPRKFIIHGHPTSVRLEPKFWYWLRMIAAERRMTVKKLIEEIISTKGTDPLSSTLRVYVANHFYKTYPRVGFVDPHGKLAFSVPKRELAKWEKRRATRAQARS